MTFDITVVAVDTYAHALTKLAIEKTLAAVPCREVLVLSDRNIFPDGRWVDINVIDIEEYNTIMIKHLWPFVRTEHVLVVQYDGMAVNAQHWDDDFLNYDYIGAVWPWPHHPPGFKVGNGGFSLRSRRLLHMLKNKEIIQHPDLPMYEDLYIGVHYKQRLVANGAKIATESVAQKFSQEHPPGRRPTLGFHGTFNVPYYLSESETENFIALNPGWNSEGSALLAIHCYLAGLPDLGRLAFDTGRRNNANFDDRVLNSLRTIPELHQNPNIQHVYNTLNEKR